MDVITGESLIKSVTTPSVRDVQLNMSSNGTSVEVRVANRTVELPITVDSESSEGLNQNATVLKLAAVVAMHGFLIEVTEQVAETSNIWNDLLKIPNSQAVP